jgi:hypothetical protein
MCGGTQIDPTTSDSFTVLSNALVVTPAGRVGINSPAPAASLEIMGVAQQPTVVQLRGSENTSQSIELGTVSGTGNTFVAAASIRADSLRRLVLDGAGSGPDAGSILLNSAAAGNVALASGGMFAVEPPDSACSPFMCRRLCRRGHYAPAVTFARR